MSVNRPGWDEYFMAIAVAVSARGDCTRRQVGAVIVRDHRLVGTGYNGAPSGRTGCLEGACPRAFKSYAEAAPGSGNYDDCIAIHAEANAIIHTRRDDCTGATLYITSVPCTGCAKLIAASGIARVVTPLSADG